MFLFIISPSHSNCKKNLLKFPWKSWAGVPDFHLSGAPGMRAFLPAVRTAAHAFPSHPSPARRIPCRQAAAIGGGKTGRSPKEKTAFGGLFFWVPRPKGGAPPLIARKSPGVNPVDFKVLPAAKRLYAALAADGEHGDGSPRKSILTAYCKSPQTLYRSRRLFAKVTFHSFCRRSSPNCNCFAGLRFDFGCEPVNWYF